MDAAFIWVSACCCKLMTVSTATADVVVQGAKVPFSMRFEKDQQGAWKFDLISLIENTKPMLEMAFNEMAKEEKITIDDLLFKTVKEIVKKEVSLKIWEGPIS